jgi:hypothetical protein
LKPISRRAFAGGIASLPAFHLASASAQSPTSRISPTEVRAITKEAYIYGEPVVDNYRIQYAYFVDRANPEYKGPWNQIWNSARLFTPADKAIQTPNSDTLYSMVGADLRAEPIVLTVPGIEKNRYFSVQLIDYYTFNFNYIGTRTTGNGGGSYLLAGPGWKGEAPKGIKKVFHCETELAFPGFRTQLFNPGDIDNVKQIQAGYKVQTLSAFLGLPAPKAAPEISFVKPLTTVEQRTSLEFFNILNFVLQFCPTVPSERALMERFARIGVGAGKTIDVASLAPETKMAMEQGMADAWATHAALQKRLEAREVTSGEFFGTRAFMKNNYLYRMAGAVYGIYGNSKEEAIYPQYAVDSTGQKLDGTNHYSLRFAPGQLPPANAFWSLTMYDVPGQLLVPNSLNRYVVNSPMIPTFKKDADGGLTLYFQNESPGVDKESNWLPAPKGPFLLVMRLYWPKPEALDGKWAAPPLKRLT